MNFIETRQTQFRFTPTIVTKCNNPFCFTASFLDLSIHFFVAGSTSFSALPGRSFIFQHFMYCLDSNAFFFGGCGVSSVIAVWSSVSMLSSYDSFPNLKDVQIFRIVTKIVVNHPTVYNARAKKYLEWNFLTPFDCFSEAGIIGWHLVRHVYFLFRVIVRYHSRRFCNILSFPIYPTCGL